MTYGKLSDEKLEKSIIRSISKLERAGKVVIDKVYKTRLYEITPTYDIIARHPLSPNNELSYQVTVIATGKICRVIHYYPSHFTKSSFWILHEADE